MVRAITAFATTFMAKRQSNRIKVMGTATGSDVQNVLRAIGPASIFPSALGGEDMDHKGVYTWNLVQLCTTLCYIYTIDYTTFTSGSWD